MPTLEKSSFVLVGLGYCLAALVLDWVSDIGLYRGLGVTPWSPTSGLSLAFTYVYGLQAWPFVLLAETSILVFTGNAGFSVPAIVVLALATSAIWLTAGEVLRNLPDFDPRLGTLQALLNLIAVAICQAAMQSGVYVFMLWSSALTDTASLYPIAWRLIVGHLVGILVVAPLLIMLHAGWRPAALNGLRTTQIVVLVVALSVVFNYRAASAYQLFYLLFLPLLWIALRDGIGGAAVMLNITQIGIIVGAQLRSDPGPTTGSLQVLMIALALTGLLVGAVVTDRHEAGRRLREQQAALNRVLRLRSAGETAAAISHQINQPLTAISTYASVAAEAVERNDMALARSALSKLTEECDRAATVARSIRELVKQGSLSKELIRLDAIAARLVQTHAAECASLGITVNVDIPGIMPTILADPIQLEQALDNLITNSIEAIREAQRGSRITLSARILAGDTYIEVRDDGPGFAPGLESIATTPFMTTKRNGTGLGLAIARSVAEAHGGSLAVTARGTGASIRLRLPTSGK